MLGRPVICHAWRIPTRMMIALMIPDGIDPTITSTGSANVRPMSMAIPSRKGGLAFDDLVTSAVLTGVAGVVEAAVVESVCTAELSFFLSEAPSAIGK